MARKSQKARLPAHDSLSNLAASLNSGKDKASADAFFVANLPRDQIEAMYRGDWLARKIVDIVPYDSIREWREWAGDRSAVASIERAERELHLRKAVQRAMTLGRLYGGGAMIVGTDEGDAATLAQPLYPDTIGPGGLRFLHVVSRWQLAASEIGGDPLDPFFGEPTGYALVGPTRGELVLHPSRVIRFLGNPLPDPMSFGAAVWSDSVLQTLYDAVHAVALTAAGTTSLVHEAKVDIVTVPNLSEHLSNAATTAQLSARFSYAAAMKSINNLLLLGDGETWARQSVDFAGLPEIVRTFLQMAAGAADIPVTRLLGQSPAGLSATGDSDTRNYYDMISARQELDLRPQLERLDALLLRSAGVDPASVSFAFRPLWQLSTAEQAAVALQKAQTSQIYAGLNLWPAATLGALVQSQLMEDGTYPGGAGAFAAGGAAADARPGARHTIDFDLSQPRDPDGRWSAGHTGVGKAAAAGLSPPNAHLGPTLAASSTEQITVTSPSAALAKSQAHAPDGTPVEVTGFHSKGRGSAFFAVLRAAAKLFGRLGRPFEHEDPEPHGIGGDQGTSKPGRHAPPISNLEKPSSEPPPEPPGQVDVPLTPVTHGEQSPKFTAQQTIGLRQLFKGGGQDGSAEGAQRLLDQLATGPVSLPPQITIEVLQRYAIIAQAAIDAGRDKLGVQAKRLKAINRILGK